MRQTEGSIKYHLVEVDDTPLLAQKQTDSVEPTQVKVITQSGRLITILALANQGIFAGLLVAKILRKTGRYHLPLIALLAPPVAFSAFRAKHLLIYYYNKDNWAKLARKHLCYFFYDLLPTRWLWDESRQTHLPNTFNHLFGFTEGIFTLNMAVLFAGMARISLDSTHGAGYLSRDLGWTWGDTHVFSNLALQSIFIASAFIANALSWPGMHRGGIKAITDIIQDFFSIFTAESDEENNEKVLALSRKFAECVNHEKHNELTQFANLLKQEEVSRQTLIDYFDCNANDLKTYLDAPPNFTEKTVSWLSGVAAVGVCGIGFYSFLDIPEICNQGLPGNLQLPTTVTNILGSMAYSSLLLLSTTAYAPTRNFVSNAFGRFTPEIDVLDHTPAHTNRKPSHRKLTLNLFSFTLCLVGAIPLIFQAVLDNESLLLIFFAACASFIIELPAVLNMYHTQAEEKVLEKNELLQFGQAGLTLFQEISEDEITEQSLAKFLKLNETKAYT